MIFSTWFTPARAGKSLVGPPTRSAPQVHPRSRGEIEVSRTPALKAGGSPPLARGNLLPGGVGGVVGGFTPARAGKSSFAATARQAVAVHPRSRGEISSTPPGPTCGGGSPPLARGNQIKTHTESKARRFTPARAGKSY